MGIYTPHADYTRGTPWERPQAQQEGASKPASPSNKRLRSNSAQSPPKVDLRFQSLPSMHMDSGRRQNAAGPAETINSSAHLEDGATVPAGAYRPSMSLRGGGDGVPPAGATLGSSSRSRLKRMRPPRRAPEDWRQMRGVQEQADRRLFQIQLGQALNV